MGPDFYAILDVAPDADAAQITRAFRQLIRTLHPDAPGADPHDSATAERLRQVLAAWHVLHDPAARAAYDQTRAAPATPDRLIPHRGGQPDSAPSAGSDFVAGPTVIHARPARPGDAELLVGPPVWLDE